MDVGHQGAVPIQGVQERAALGIPDLDRTVAGGGCESSLLWGEGNGVYGTFVGGQGQYLAVRFDGIVECHLGFWDVGPLKQAAPGRKCLQGQQHGGARVAALQHLPRKIREIAGLGYQRLVPLR